MTSIENAAASVSCAAVCLRPEEPGCNHRAALLFRTAPKKGKLEILTWGEESGYELKKMMKWFTPIADAALNGHLEVVIYLRQLELPWNEQTCRNAAMKGHLDLLKWCRGNKCPWDAETCANAATRSRLELLKWARVNQCPWDAETCANAAEYGDLEMLSFCTSKICCNY